MWKENDHATEMICPLTTKACQAFRRGLQLTGVYNHDHSCLSCPIYREAMDEIVESTLVLPEVYLPEITARYSGQAIECAYDNDTSDPYNLARQYLRN